MSRFSNLKFARNLARVHDTERRLAGSRCRTEYTIVLPTDPINKRRKVGWKWRERHHDCPFCPAQPLTMSCVHRFPFLLFIFLNFFFATYCFFWVLLTGLCFSITLYVLLLVRVLLYVPCWKLPFWHRNLKTWIRMCCECCTIVQMTNVLCIILSEIAFLCCDNEVIVSHSFRSSICVALLT